MTPAEVATALRWRLASDIETELASHAKVADRVAELRSRLGSEPGDWVVASAMAFEIERWYTAVESLFVRILRTLEGDVPAGPAHHRELVRVASLAVEPLRPALLPAAAESDFRDLLGFRHIARHAYDVEPEPARMLEHADRVARPRGALGVDGGARPPFAVREHGLGLSQADEVVRDELSELPVPVVVGKRGATCSGPTWRMARSTSEIAPGARAPCAVARMSRPIICNSARGAGCHRNGSLGGRAVFRNGTNEHGGARAAQATCLVLDLIRGAASTLPSIGSYRGTRIVQAA